MGLHSITASRAAARRPRFCVAAIRVVCYHAHFDQLYGYGVARKHGTRQRAPEFMFTPPPVDAFHISYRTTPLTTTYGSCFLSRPPADGWLVLIGVTRRQRYVPATMLLAWRPSAARILFAITNLSTADGPARDRRPGACPATAAGRAPPLPHATGTNCCDVVLIGDTASASATCSACPEREGRRK